MKKINDPLHVLIVGNPNHIFIKHLARELKIKYNIKIDIMSLSGHYKKSDDSYDNIYSISRPLEKDQKPIRNIINKISYYFVIKDIIRNFKHYDVINIHYMRSTYRFFSKAFKSKTSKFCISLWGSDFYRINDKERKRLEKVFKISDCITFTNEYMKKDFLNYYKKFSAKLEVCRFGLKPLEIIKGLEEDGEIIEAKKSFLRKYGIDEDKILITCGYNSSLGQQHEAIINQILSLDQVYLREIIFLFPLTYGDDQNREKIKRILSGSDLEHVIFEEFMDDREVAILRLISDIMINVQISDQFSGSMQETLFGGNIVINGNWLPYDTFKEKGIFYLEIDNIDKLRDKIVYAIDNRERFKSDCNNNKFKIWELSSWEKNLSEWHKIYQNKGGV